MASIGHDTDALLAAGQGQASSPPPPGLAGLLPLLRQRSVRVVEWGGWARVDAAEVAAGQLEGRVREKIVDPARQLQLAGV